MKISIIGTGYVGLVTAVCLAEKGLYVTCVDIDKEKVDSINKCVSPIFEDDLETLLKENVINNHLRATTDLQQAIMETDISIIAVGTPFDGNKIDLSQIIGSAEGIGCALKIKDSYHVIIIKSTIVPGTTDNVITPVIEKYSRKKVGMDFGIGMNPEFLREGCAISDFMNPDRIVIGGIDKRTIDKIKEMYEPFEGIDIIITNNKTAEMIKYASNSLLATLISFSNEIANICCLIPGVDITDVMAGVHLDKRLNPLLSGGTRVNPGILNYLEAGCGFGGSCFPKDVKSLISYAEEIGNNPTLLRSVIEVNQRQPKKLIEMINKNYDEIDNLIITILGLAFKPGTDDLRDSPAIPIIKYLHNKVKLIRLYDPIARDNAKKIFKSTDRIEYPISLEDAIENSDIILLITKWKEFGNLASILKKKKYQPLVIDGRRFLNKNEYCLYEGIGLYRLKGKKSSGSVPI